VNQQFYLTFLWLHQEAVGKKDQNLVGTQLVASLQYCCCACGTVCPEVSVTYDLDHSPGDIFLFPNMKGNLIRHQFESGEEIHKKH
jgi:hypothetical protein